MRIQGTAYALLVLLTTSTTAGTAAELARGVVGTGAATSTGTNVRLRGTLGQPAVGLATSGTTRHHAGFWHGELPGVTAIQKILGVLPAAFGLSQNVPNPFNPHTTIRFALPERSMVSLKVYSPRGDLVRTLADAPYPAGVHVVELDGRGMSSGIYFYRLQADKFTETRKLTLLK